MLPPDSPPPARRRGSQGCRRRHIIPDQRPTLSKPRGGVRSCRERSVRLSGAPEHPRTQRTSRAAIPKIETKTMETKPRLDLSSAPTGAPALPRGRRAGRAGVPQAHAQSTRTSTRPACIKARPADATRPQRGGVAHPPQQRRSGVGCRGPQPPHCATLWSVQQPSSLERRGRMACLGGFIAKRPARPLVGGGLGVPARAPRHGRATSQPEGSTQRGRAAVPQPVFPPPHPTSVSTPIDRPSCAPQRWGWVSSTTVAPSRATAAATGRQSSRRPSRRSWPQ